MYSTLTQEYFKAVNETDKSKISELMPSTFRHQKTSEASLTRYFITNNYCDGGEDALLKLHEMWSAALSCLLASSLAKHTSQDNILPLSGAPGYRQ